MEIPRWNQVWSAAMDATFLKKSSNAGRGKEKDKTEKQVETIRQQGRD